MVRILIVDDHAVVRQGLRNLIATHPEWDICGEAGEGQAALVMAKSLSPDLAIVDVALPFMSGLVLTRQLQDVCSRLRTLLFSFIDDEETIASGLAAGALGYVLKSEESEVLEAAIAAVADGRTHLSPAVLAIAQTASDDRKRNWIEILTPRELEVLQLVAGGRSNKQVAYMLSISIKTVEVHRGSAMRKADLRSTADLVRFAIRHRLVQ